MASNSSAAPTLHTPPLELPLDDLLERLGGEQEMLQTLAQMQLEESPRALEEIRGLLNGSDAQQVERAAHKLVGSLLVFGADEAVAAARSVEHSGRDGKLADARGQFPQLEREVHRVIAALDRVVNTSHT